MRHQLRLGRFLGVAVNVDASWFIIAYLITLSVVRDFHAHHPRWSDATVLLTALITAFLFFVTIVVHELSHAMVARHRGVPVRSITLFALGGVANLERETSDPTTEFWMALVGPLTSLAIGGLCLWLGHVDTSSWRTPVQPVLALLIWLGYINVGLALFNMIPGFPLDGGRVMRALLWWITGNGALATLWAARLGFLVAMSFILIGVYRFFHGAGINGLWIAFIGWFLKDASHATLARLPASGEIPA